MLLQLIYDIGQQASNFYIILSGRIDTWSHPPGSSRCGALCYVMPQCACCNRTDTLLHV
jgi:hypothetical protein